MGLTSKILAGSFSRIASKMITFGDELNALDAKIGDGDLGVTLTRCAKAILEILPPIPEDIGLAFMNYVQAVTKVSGASFATLLSTALMSLAKATKGRTEIPWSEISDLLNVANEAMIARGKAVRGEKTVIDAVEAARVATMGLSDPGDILGAANNAVQGIIEKMRNQPNKAGRARIWGEKSVGLDDPGMIAFKLMLESLKE
jgi:phosphoenolpyruvate---glycerone phosphotransferase subunit DhaL